jgi:hypothetical protein
MGFGAVLRKDAWVAAIDLLVTVTDTYATYFVLKDLASPLLSSHYSRSTPVVTNYHHLSLGSLACQ